MYFVYFYCDDFFIRVCVLGGFICLVSVMIEIQVLEWDLVGCNFEKLKVIFFLFEEDFYNNVNCNFIFCELGFWEYYCKYFGFY